MEKPLDRKAVATALGVSVRTLNAMIKRGEFMGPYEIGGKLCWDEDDIALFITWRKRLGRSPKGEDEAVEE